MNCCENCKYSDLDYIFDDEIGEEYPIYTCKKGHNKLLNFDYIADRREVLTQQEECADFEEYKPEPYKEEDTECDKCYKKNECIKNGYLVNSTFSQDTREHYIKGRGCVCVNGCEEFLEMKLSEILEIADTEDMKKFIRKAIDQLGDMTYREFYQEQRCLELFK